MSQTSSATMSLRLTEASLRGLDNRASTASQHSIDERGMAERSINFIQQRQSTASGASRSRAGYGVGSASAQKKTSNELFSTPGAKTSSKYDGDKPYFHKRFARTQGRRGSGQYDSKKNNPAAHSYDADPNKQHAHLEEFLRDQVRSQKAGNSDKKDTVSCTSQKKNNILIEQAKNKYTTRSRSKNSEHNYNARRSIEPPTCAEGKDEKELQVAQNVMRLAGYQADPLAATMNTRSLGLSKINVSKDQIAIDKDLYRQSKQVNKTRGREGLVIAEPDSVSIATSKIASPRIIKEMSAVEAALYRKKISEKYHTSVPKFLRSQGPFAVYEHSAHKGGATFATFGAAHEQGVNRFNSEVQQLQQKREFEKDQFYSSLDYMDKCNAFAHQNRVNQNRANRDFILNQIAERQRVRSVEKDVDTLYYKPHFGPEETLDQVKKNLNSQKMKQEYLLKSLTNQINTNRELSDASRAVERAHDQKFIKHQIEAQTLENNALAKKDQAMK